MLGQGKLINLKTTDEGLVAEIAIESMTAAMVDAVLEHVYVELSLPTARAHVKADVVEALADRVPVELGD